MMTLQLSSDDNTQLKHLAKILRRNERPRVRRFVSLAVITAAVVIATACSHAMMMMHGTGAKRPAASEFGLGPRSSANGIYAATLEPSRELRPRQMQTIRVAIVDREGRAVVGAALTIDGGMPEHGHGLPTRPRMSRIVSDGTYEIEGVRFNMGGWWVFKLTITSERGADTVTFNLGL
jgi:hypothetical protein